MTTADHTLTGLSIVSALINGVQVPIACPAAWCTENHTGENIGHAEDVDHAGAHVDVMVPRLQGGDELFAYAHLGQDTYATDPKMRAAHIRVEDGGGEVSYLTPGQADTFAANLTTFAAQIRTLARVAREQTEDPDRPDASDAAFSTALDAIQAAVNASGNLSQTRAALRNAVDLYADEARS